MYRVAGRRRCVCTILFPSVVQPKCAFEGKVQWADKEQRVG